MSDRRTSDRRAADGPQATEKDADLVPPAFEPRAVWTVTQAAAVLLILGFFLMSMRDVLSPFLLFALLVAALLPFRELRGHGLLLGLAGGLAIVWFIASAGSLLAPFVLSAVLAYVLDPLVDRLQKLGVGRTPGIVILVVPAIAALVALVVLGVPAVARQFQDFAEAVPELIARLQTWGSNWADRLHAFPIVGEAVNEWIASLDADAIVGLLQERSAEIGSRAWGAVLGVGRGIGFVMTVAGYLVLTPVLTFYLLRDWDAIVARVEDLLPRGRRDAIVRFAGEYDTLLGHYLRGQITVALVMGALTTVGLWVSSFPYAILIGALVAIFSVVPYLGLVLSLLPAVVVALSTGAVLVSLLKVAIVFGVVQGLEGTVVSPRIVGDSVGLHPVWVVLALTAGGFYLGFVGLLLGVPIAVGVKLLVLRGLERYRASEAYTG